MKKIIFLLFILTPSLVLSYSEPKNFTDSFKKAKQANNIDEKIFYWQKTVDLYITSYKEKYLFSAKKMLAFAYYEKGRKFLNINALSNALNSFEKALDLNVGEAYPFSWILHIFKNYSKIDEGISWCSKKIDGLTNKKRSFNRWMLIYIRAQLKNLQKNSTTHLVDYKKLLKTYSTITYHSFIKKKASKMVQDKIPEIYKKVIFDYLKNAQIKKAVQTSKNAQRFDSTLKNNTLAYAVFLSYFKQCWVYFINNQYNKALIFFDIAHKLREKHPYIKKNTRFTEGFNYYKNLIKAHHKLGRFKPKYVHKIKVLYFLKTKVNEIDYAISGKRIKISNKITPAMKKNAIIHEQILKKMIEVYSQGQWSLKFTYSNITTPLNKLLFWYFGKKPYISIDRHHASISLGPDKWHNLIKNEDTILSYWNGEGISLTSTGGGFTSPYDSKALRGGMVIPINYLSYPKTWSHKLLAHEFFHVIELMCKIKPTHGANKEVRKYFTGWKGEGELDYILWHFTKTLKKIKYKNLIFAKKYPAKKNRRDLNRNQNFRYLYGRTKDSQYKNEQFTNLRFKESRKLKPPKSLKVKKPFSFVFISDIHLMNQKHEKLNQLHKIIKPGDAFILTGGDLTQDGNPKDMKEYIKLISKHKLPVYHVAGNHDFWKQTEWPDYKKIIGSSTYTFSVDNLFFIITDSASQTFGSNQRKWLEKKLKQNQGKEIIIVSHTPFFVKKAYEAGFLLPEKKELIQLYEKYGVKWLLNGHTHVNYDVKLNNIHYITVGIFIDKQANYMRFYYDGKKLTYERKLMK